MLLVSIVSQIMVRILFDQTGEFTVYLIRLVIPNEFKRSSGLTRRIPVYLNNKFILINSLLVEDQRFILSTCDYAILRHKDDKSLLQLAQSVYEALGKTPTDFGNLEKEKSIVSQLLVSNGSMDVDIQIPARHVCPICTSDIL